MALTKHSKPRSRWKLLPLISVGALGVVLASTYGAKLLLEAKAVDSAERFIAAQPTSDKSDEEKVLILAKAVYQTVIEGRKTGDVPLLFRLRPYLSHQLLPEIIRIKSGAIEALYLHGVCDSATRRLNFVLEAAGYPATQFNIVSPTGGHTVTIAQLPSEQWVMLDPFYGVAPMWNGKLIGPQETQRLLRNGASPDKVWNIFASTSKLQFYRNFDRARMAQQGHTLKIQVVAKLEENASLILGKKDNSSADVKTAAIRLGWSPYWTYLGHRYDRGWERSIRFPQKTRVTFQLTSEVNTGFITSQVPPTKIQGNQLIYELEAGGVLHFRDGLAKRNWIDLKSYQDVDYILFEALN